ncbi:hypothetical protein [Pseudocitrobacter corydidari]|uniref:Uncharacterized protein n=1 Tax=Pseudocitrobacter corydidari TaxID=2891570 RepID=A0ABY3S2E6_9ENTR|nr:hypothetical protein [Pseudocitrobacter corydidari]UGS40832.1 hypothetical protein G163CM_15310 [Pseudocitrobacter corydidari]
MEYFGNLIRLLVVCMVIMPLAVSIIVGLKTNQNQHSGLDEPAKQARVWRNSILAFLGCLIIGILVVLGAITQ